MTDGQAAAANLPASRGRERLRTLLGVGIAWLMLGMVVMPAGVSFNPGKGYQDSLALLLYLPALYLAFSHRAAAWRQLWPLPAFRVFLLLLAWAAASLAWGGLAHPADDVGRLLSVLAFVLGWHVCMTDDAPRIRKLLLFSGLGIGVCALYYCIGFELEPTQDGRITGVGTIGTTNYAAALMGVVAVWLSQLEVQGRWWSVSRWGAIAALLLFVVLTHTRNVWLALCVCMLLMPLWRPERGWRWLAATVLLADAATLLRPLPVLAERGTSLRPELFMQSLRQIEMHPWLGLGQGVSFTLMVDGLPYTHTHNVLTQTTMELGVPGLLLVLALWVLVAVQGWRHRRCMQGRLILALWVYASVVLQFDMPQLLDSPRPGWLLVWMPFAMALGLDWRQRLLGQTKAAQ